jgi:hypothetical protein
MEVAQKLERSGFAQKVGSEYNAGFGGKNELGENKCEVRRTGI